MVKQSLAQSMGKQYCDVKKRLIIIKSELYRESNLRPPKNTRTFYDWGEYWLEKIIKPHIKTGTYSGYRRNLERHIYPFLMEILITDITSEDIQEMVNALQVSLAPGNLAWCLQTSEIYTQFCT